MELILKKETPKQDLRKSINYSELYDLCIIGAGPAGLTAALYALRKKMKTALVAKDVGGQLMYAFDIQNFPGQKMITGFDLARLLEEQLKPFPLEQETDAEVTAIEKKETVLAHLNNGKTVKCKTLLIATGKKYRKLEVKGETDFSGKGVSYCTTCDAPLFRNRTVAVVGGGNSALGAALELSKIANKVYLLMRRDVFRADETLVEKVKSENKIEVRTKTVIKEVKGKQFVEAADLENVENKVVTEVKLDGIFIEIGLIPNTAFLKNSGIKLTADEEILISAQNETNLEGIYAAGDVTMISEKQIVISAGEGAKAALSAYKYLQNRK